MNLNANFVRLLIFSAAFAVFVPIGTLSHEYGHIAVAEFLGYKTTLQYNSMDTEVSEDEERFKSIYTEFKDQIDSSAPFPRQDEYKQLVKSLTQDHLMITIGGPLQTILISVIGLLILYLRRMNIRKGRLNFIDWLAVFLSLFWLREVFNLAISLGSGFINGSGDYFRGDESAISDMLKLPVGAVSLILGILGAMISAFIVFRVIPGDQRIVFIAGGLLGGLSGFVLWMYVLGPVLLP